MALSNIIKIKERRLIKITIVSYEYGKKSYKEKMWVYRNPPIS